MRSGLTAVVVAAGVAGVLAVVSFVGPPESVVEEHPDVQEPVVRTSLVCPFVGGEADGEAELGVFALPDVPAVEGEETTPITARELDVVPEPGEEEDAEDEETEDEAEAEEPEETEEPAEPLVTLEERGVLDITQVESSEPVSVAIEGRDALAPGLVAEQSLLIDEVDLHGLATATCGPAAREHWFVGGSGEIGKRGRLVLANPTSVAAVVNVELWDEAGPIDAPATQGIGVPARSRTVLLLDALAPESERIGVHISTTQGRVSTALEVRETDGTTPLGMSYVPPAQSPRNQVVVPGVPGHGERVLRIFAPGETDAIVSLRMLGPSGPFSPVDSEVVTVPSGSVFEMPVEGNGDDPVAVELDSDEPITASVRVVDEPEDGQPDVAFTAATPPLDGPVAALLGRASDGFTTTLHLSSVGDASSRVEIATLDESGAVVSEEAVDVPAGSTVPVEVELPDDASFASVLVDPGQPGTVVMAREISAADDDGAFLDLVPLWSPIVQVAVPRVVGELPGVLDPSPTSE